MAVIQGPSVQVRESSIVIKSMRKEVDSHIHTAELITKDPLASHHTHSGHGGMMAVANIADGTMDFCCLIRCGLRLATGWMVSCRASAIRLYVCKTWKGPIDMNLAVMSAKVLTYF